MIKYFIEQALSRLGYQVVRTRPVAPQSAERFEKLEYLDGFLEGQLAAGRPICILQCGANDGVTVDPVRAFILRHPDKVKAVLAEPLPDVFDALVANYADHVNVTTLNVAVGPDRQIILYRIKPEYISKYNGIIATGVTSFDRNYVLNKAAGKLDVRSVPPEDRIEHFMQKCLTVSQIIDAYPAQLGAEPFLQIDAEGFDDQIIYTIDFMRHRPIAINYEVRHLSEEKRGALRDYLSTSGYYFIKWKRTDELAVRIL